MLVKVIYGALAVGTAGLLSICELCTRPAELATRTAYAGVVASPVTLSNTAEAQATTTVMLDVQGMTCGGCVVGVRTVLKRLPGVTKADVQYEAHRAVVTYDPSKVTVRQMVAAIATLNYTATPITPKSAPPGT